MKTKYALLSTVLTVALTLPMFGQATYTDTTMTGMKQHDMSSMMGKPTADVTVQGLHMKVWLMTQQQHKDMMMKQKDEMMMHGEQHGDMGHEGMHDTGMAMSKDMGGMKHEGMEMSKAMKDSMMAGTHHIMLVATDATTGKEIESAVARILIVSPSKKNSSVDLKPMMNHFGGALTLPEWGNYQFTVNVTAGGVTKTTQFQYTVK